jgi:hypothetical protein
VEIAMHFRDSLARVFVGGDEHDVDVRVKEQDTEQLGAAVA